MAVTARYIRLTGTAGSTINASAAEVYVRGSTGVKIIPSATSADSAEPGFLAAAANDDNTSTLWHTHFSSGDAPDYPHYYLLDLGLPKVITDLRYVARGDSPNGIISTYTIEASNDAVSWTQVASGNFSVTQGQTATVTLSGYTGTLLTPANARYVRLTGTAGSTVEASASEIFVRNTEGTKLVPSAVSADSEESSTYNAAKANDNNLSTIWHTQFSGGDPPYPHFYLIDLGTAQDVADIIYRARTDHTNAIISTYTIETSNDAASWTQVASGNFGITQSGTAVVSISSSAVDVSPAFRRRMRRPWLEVFGIETLPKLLRMQPISGAAAAPDFVFKRRAPRAESVDLDADAPKRRLRVTPPSVDAPAEFLLWIGFGDDSEPKYETVQRRTMSPAAMATLASTSGSGSAALSPFAIAAAGLVTFIGVGSAAASSFAAAGSAAETFAGTGSAALSAFACSGTGAETYTCSGSAALSPFAISGSGAEAFSCSGSAARSPFACSGTAAETHAATGSAALSSFAISGTAAEGYAATGSAAASPFAITGTGSAPQAVTGSGSAATSPFAISGNAAVGAVFTCTGSAAVSPFAISGSGAEAFIATGSAALSSFACSGTGAEAFSCSGSAAASPFACSANAAVGSVFTSSGSVAVSPFAISGSGAEAFTGTGSAARSTFAISGTGAEAFTSSGSAAASPFACSGNAAVGSVFTCTGSAAVSLFAASGTCTEAFIATGSAALSSFACSATVSKAHSCSGSAAASPFACSGNAAVGSVFTSSGSAALSPFAISGSSTESFTSNASAAASAFACSGTATETFASSGSAALSPFACSGTGLAPQAVAGSGSAALSPFACSSNAAVGSVFTCTGSAAASSFGVAGTVSEIFISVGAAVLSQFACGGVSAETFSCTASAARSPFACSGVAFTPQAIAGTGSAAASSFACSAAILQGLSFVVCSGSAAVSPFGATGSGPTLASLYGQVTAITAASGAGWRNARPLYLVRDQQSTLRYRLISNTGTPIFLSSDPSDYIYMAIMRSPTNTFMRITGQKGIIRHDRNVSDISFDASVWAKLKPGSYRYQVWLVKNGAQTLIVPYSYLTIAGPTRVR